MLLDWHNCVSIGKVRLRGLSLYNRNCNCEERIEQYQIPFLYTSPCRWKDNNGPKETDYTSLHNLIRATPKGVKRFVLTTSAGVLRSDKIPYSILNLCGV